MPENVLNWSDWPVCCAHTERTTHIKRTHFRSFRSLGGDNYAACGLKCTGLGVSVELWLLCSLWQNQEVSVVMAPCILPELHLLTAVRFSVEVHYWCDLTDISKSTDWCCSRTLLVVKAMCQLMQVWFPLTSSPVSVVGNIRKGFWQKLLQCPRKFHLTGGHVQSVEQEFTCTCSVNRNIFTRAVELTR